MSGMRSIVLFLVWTLGASHAWADWKVERAHVGFASVKNEVVAENHSFTHVTGLVSESGEVEIKIALDSVETLIPIRNQRMQEILFNTDMFPSATIRCRLKMSEYTDLKVGDSKAAPISMKINLHGAELTKSVMTQVTRTDADTFIASSLGPIILHASQFTLSEGIEALRIIAGLVSIELIVACA